MANKTTSNAISFNDVVSQLQQLNKTAKAQEKQATKTNDLEKMIVAIDAFGEKTLVKEEQVIEEQSKESKQFHTKTISALKDINACLSNIANTLTIALSGKKIGVGTEGATLSPSQKQGTTLTEDQEEENKKRDFLVDKLYDGILGVKNSLDKGLGKLGKEFSTGFGAMKDAYLKGSGSGGGLLGGLKGMWDKGVGTAKGGWGGLKNKAGSIKEAFSAGKAEGGIGRGVGSAFRSVAPNLATKAAGGMESAAGMIRGAGPLATAAGIGLAGYSLYDRISTNAQTSEDIEKNVASGAITRNEGNVLQGESFGDTAGTAAGATIGGIAGSALGPLGAAAGAWLGGKVGGWAGGKIGKYGVKAYQGIKSMLGFGETKEQAQAKMTPEQKAMNQYTSGEISADEYNKKLKLQAEGGSQPTPNTEGKNKPGISAKEANAKLDAEKLKADSSTTPVIASATKEESIIQATPTQESSGATGTGVWDKIKSGAGKAAMLAMPAVGLGYMGGKAIAGKASEWGKGIKDWFGGTKVGQALADRNKGVGDAKVGETLPEMMVSSKEKLTETSSSANGSSTKYDQGITSEKSALGSTWLGKLIAGKGTETENFISTSETANEKGGKYASFLGKRTEGGWFNKDKYSITGDDGKAIDVDKATYMRAKGIAKTGGDASDISSFLPKVSAEDKGKADAIHTNSVAATDAKENVTKASGGNAVVNAPTVVNNTTNQSSNIRSPIRNEESSVNRYMRSRFAY